MAAGLGYTHPAMPAELPFDPGRALSQAQELYRAGRLPEAERLCRQALAADPGSARGHALLGLLALHAGQPRAAAELCGRASALDPRDPDCRITLGAALMTLGRAEAGIQAFREAAGLRPGDAQAHYNLGLALLGEGRLDEAEAALAKAVRRAPKSAEAHMNLGLARLRLGRREEALRALRRAVSLAPRAPLPRANLANALLESGAYEEATAAFEAALALAPGEASLHHGMGRALAGQRRPLGALACYRRAAELAPEHAGVLNSLGMALAAHGSVAEAERLLRRAAALAPGETRLRLNLAELLVDLGRAGEAAAIFREVAEAGAERAYALRRLADLAQQEGDFAAARRLAERVREGGDEAGAFALLAEDGDHCFSPAEIARMEALIAPSRASDEAQEALHFALAAAYERAGERERSFPHLRAAHSLVARRQPYDPAETDAFTERAIAAFSPEFFAARAALGSESERPLFIVGMPRSGTTLVEQILASHSAVAAAGELELIGAFAATLPERLGSGTPYPGCVADLGGEVAAELGRLYLARLDLASTSTARVTDKMPGNFAHLGLIALLFPKARVLWCRRDPLDTCVSIYRQRFPTHHPYAHDLGHLGHYFRAHERLMAHWRRVLPNPILEVGYEELVRDLEGASRRMAAFVGLEWDARVLAFYQTRRTVKTASAWQVRRPVFATSIGRWRAFEAELSPLRAALGLA